LPTARCEVKTIGFSGVPSAMSFPPRRTYSELPATVVSPTILVPGLMVSTAPLSTFTKPLRT
jgi:hypothetical protein